MPLLNSTSEVRVRVSRALDRPFIFEKVLKLAPGIVKNVLFFYENLVDMCFVCKMIFHCDGVCKLKVVSSKSDTVQKENRMVMLANLANPNFSKGSLKFTDAPVVEAPPIFKLMQPIAASKATLKRMPIVRKKTSPGSDTTTSANSRTALQEIDVNVETSLTANQLLLPASSPATEVVIETAPIASVNRTLIPQKLHLLLVS